MWNRALHVWAGLAGLCLLAQPAQAQLGETGSAAPPLLAGGVLPGLGGGTSVGDLRPQLERYFQPSLLPATAPAYVIQPSIGVDVGFTDNAGRGRGNGRSGSGRSDAFTVISPTVVVTGDSARIKTNLAYAPQIQLYASTSNQDQVSNFFNGQSLITLAPDAVFLDLRGAVTQSSILGSGFNNGQTSTYNRQNQVQTTSFSITPYAEHRFGGWGTARIGYSFARTLQDSASGIATGNTVDVFGNPVNVNPVNGSQGYGSIGNLTTQRERATFATGENLGRFNDLTTLEAIQYGGSGSYGGSHRNQALNELGFALTRKITLLGGIGYQDILYSGGSSGGGRNNLVQSNVRINEPTWTVGTRYTPNQDSAVTVLFGRRDGRASVSFDGQFAPTARTRVFGRYSTGITSDIEDAQNLLDTTSVGPAGLVTDSATGAPVSGGSVFGVQNGVYRVSRLSLSGLFLANRDSYSVSVGQEDRTTLTTSTSFFSNNVVPAGTNTSSVFVSASWQHDLAPDLSSNVSAQYASSNNTSQLLGATSGRQDTFSIAASLNKQFTQTLTGNVRYIHSEQLGAQGFTSSRINSNNYSENALLVGLRKSF